MKKATLILAALALVLGISQCKKQEEPAQNGQKQHVVLNASFANGNSKIAQQGTGLKWVEGDKLMVGGAGSGELTCVTCTDPTIGIFEGEITASEGTITFTFGAQNFDNQTGDLNDAIQLTGEDTYKPSGNYTATMTMPHAVLKLDLSAFGPATGSTTVNIKAGGVDVASVKDITTASKAVYVALPAAESTTYTFTGNHLAATKQNWPLNANTFYTASSHDGAAIVIVPDAVEFGNVYWATTNIGATTPKDYGWYFSWAGTTGYVRDGSKWVTAQGGSELSDGFTLGNTPYHTGPVQTSDWYKYIPTGKTNYWAGGGSPDNKLSLDLEDDAARANWGGSWRMPTQANFQALYEACGGTGSSVGPTVLSSANPGKGIYWVNSTQEYISDYNGVAGILFCDGTSKLFFVAAGYGLDNQFNGGGTEGRYWSGTVNSGLPQHAYRLGFRSGDVSPENINVRNQGFPIRPVHD